MERPPTSRLLDVLTALLLGVVSLTTALGAWQAAAWDYRADQYEEASSDARDAGIIRGVAWQADRTRDTEAVLRAREFALQQDAAIAAGDVVAATYSEVMVGNQLGRIVTDGIPDAFARWRAAGFPTDQSPTSDPVYLANLRGDSDAYALTAQLASGFRESFEARSRIMSQAALIDALALFLFGVASINRLRAARYATLALGAVAYLASLVLMATAY